MNPHGKKLLSLYGLKWNPFLGEVGGFFVGLKFSNELPSRVWARTPPRSLPLRRSPFCCQHTGQSTGDLSHDRLRTRTIGGGPSGEKVRALEAFLLAFDTELPPVVGAQLALDRETAATRSARLDLLRSQATSGNVELVVHGVVDGERRGFVYRRPEQAYQSDRQAEQLTEEELLRPLERGTTLTWTAVYQGIGERIGIDRDQDGVSNADEADLGSDPSDPHDVPRSYNSLNRRSTHRLRSRSLDLCSALPKLVDSSEPVPSSMTISIP